MKNDIWNIVDLINTTTEFLRSKSVDAPRTSTELLLAHTLHMKRLELYLNFDKPVKHTELEKFRVYIKRRINREPVQYIIGDAEFMSLPFKVNKNVMIPRPETELFVEIIIDRFRNSADNELYILDIGTGSGNIAISLAKYLKNSNIIATDIDDNILDIAEHNARINGVSDKIKFKNESVFEVVNEYKCLDIIVSNPPYVSKTEFEELQPEVKSYEPFNSICDNSDGLTFYKEIVKKAKIWLDFSGEIFFEIGHNQGETVREILQNNNFSSISILKDYAKLDRIVTAKNVKD